MSKINDFQLSKNFNLKEFECPCCHRVMLSNELIMQLQFLRNDIWLPIIITSGFRCDSYNEKVGGVPGSYHKLGMAVDVTIKNGKLTELYFLAKELKFTGIGIYPKRYFLHLDIRPGDLVEWAGDQ